MLDECEPEGEEMILNSQSIDHVVKAVKETFDRCDLCGLYPTKAEDFLK